MSISYHGHIDSEDGVLLFGDAAALQMWQGTDQEPENANLILNALRNELSGLVINVGQKTSIMWNIKGPGTVDIFAKSNGDIVLVRFWADEEIDSDMETEAIDLPPDNNRDLFGEFSIQCGYLSLFWPGENGRCISNTPGQHYFMNEREMMTDTSGLIIPLENGTYRCTHDEVHSDVTEYRRCYIRKINLH